MKFIHIADVHLGVEPDAGREWSKKRAQDIWDSFGEVVLEAGKQKVDFLFIAGDLFHRQPLKRELKEVNYLFEQIPEVKVVLMAGNHDYLQPKSYYLDFPWAKNVSFFTEEEIRAFDFPEENVTVYGLSYWHQQIRQRLYDEIWVENENRVNILLAHGGAEKQIPFLPRQILENGIDYIAAGHIHKTAYMAGDAAVMAGALEPVDCNDVGPHGYWMGELVKGDHCIKRNLVFCPIKKCEYRQETIFMMADMTQYALEEMVRERVAEGEPCMRYRIFLEGYVNPDCEFDYARIAQMEQVVDVTANLIPNYNYDKMMEEQSDSMLGRYIVRMKKEPQDVVTAKALEMGVNALLGHKICR